MLLAMSSYDKEFIDFEDLDLSWLA